MLAGKYTADVVSTDNAGGVSRPATAVWRPSANKPPTAPSGPGQRGHRAAAITFTDQSKDSDGQVVAVRWDFGDGATDAERIRRVSTPRRASSS